MILSGVLMILCIVLVALLVTIVMITDDLRDIRYDMDRIDKKLNTLSDEFMRIIR